MGVLERDLDRLEAAQADISGSRIIEYSGSIDLDLLDRSLQILCDLYPMLRARILSRGSQLYLSASDEHRPQLTEAGSLDEIVNSPFENADGVGRLSFARAERTGYVGLRLSHAVADGRHFLAVFSDLWRIYTMIVNGEAIAAGAGRSLPRCPSELLRDRWPETLPAFGSNISSEVRVLDLFHKRVRLTVCETADLVATASMQSISVHGLVYGAILTALHSSCMSVHDSLGVLCLSMVDLRSRVTPLVAPTEVTNFAVPHSVPVAVNARDTPVSIGRKISNRIMSDIRNNTIFSGKDDDRVRRLVLSVSNTGVVPTFCRPDNLEFHDFRVLLPARVQVNDPDAGRPSLGCSVNTFNDRLSLELFTSLPKLNGYLDSFAGTVWSHLRAAARVVSH